MSSFGSDLIPVNLLFIFLRERDKADELMKVA